VGQPYLGAYPMHLYRLRYKDRLRLEWGASDPVAVQLPQG